MDLESKFERDFLKKVASLPGVYVPSKVDSMAVRGLPDRVICVNGHYVALEFKRNAKELRGSRSRLQEYELNKITEAGGVARFVTPDNASTIFQLIERLLK